MNSPASFLNPSLALRAAGIVLPFGPQNPGFVEFERKALAKLKKIDDLLDGNVSRFVRRGARVTEEAKTTAMLLTGINAHLGLNLNEKNLDLSGKDTIPHTYQQEIKKFQHAFNEAIEEYGKFKGDLNKLTLKHPGQADLYKKIDELVKSDPNYATKGTSRWLDFRLSVDGVIGNWTGTALSALSSQDGAKLLFAKDHVDSLNIVAGGYWIGKTAEEMPEAKRNRDSFDAKYRQQYSDDGDPVPGSYASYDNVNIQGTGVVGFRYGRDANRVAPRLLAALNEAAKDLGFKRIYISCAIEGHAANVKGTNRRSRHMSGIALDIGAIDGYACNTNSRIGGAKAQQLVDWLRNKGFVWNEESGNDRAVLWKTMKGGNHYNHIHMSMKR